MCAEGECPDEISFDAATEKLQGHPLPHEPEPAHECSISQLRLNAAVGGLCSSGGFGAKMEAGQAVQAAFGTGAGADLQGVQLLRLGTGAPRSRARGSELEKEKERDEAVA